MKAKCPYCCNNEKPGCDWCKDGFLEVGFELGYCYTVKCQNPECGFENGMRIDKRPDFPEIVKPDINCIECGGDTEYLLVGEISDEESSE